MCIPPPRLLNSVSALGQAPGGYERGRRLLLLLLGVWLVNLFDLGFTLVASEQRLMTELNPLASRVMGWGTAAIIAYKLLLLTLGSAILWWQRRRLLTELALWAYAGICVGLALHWQNIYHVADPMWIEAGMMREVLPPHAYWTTPIPGRRLDGGAQAHGPDGAPADSPLDDLEDSDRDNQAGSQPLPPGQRPEPGGCHDGNQHE